MLKMTKEIFSSFSSYLGSKRDALGWFLVVPTDKRIWHDETLPWYKYTGTSNPYLSRSHLPIALLAINLWRKQLTLKEDQVITIGFCMLRLWWRLGSLFQAGPGPLPKRRSSTASPASHRHITPSNRVHSEEWARPGEQHWSLTVPGQWKSLVLALLGEAQWLQVSVRSASYVHNQCSWHSFSAVNKWMIAWQKLSSVPFYPFT